MSLVNTPAAVMVIIGLGTAYAVGRTLIDWHRR